jgi:ABC-type nitrate/sulfonate/bicarbonate transport system substrate-binding protein
MKKPLIYTISLVCLVVIAVALFFFKYAPVKEKVLRIGYDTSSIVDAPIIVANDAGIFSKHNLKVELFTFQSSKEVQQALAVGKLDIASSGATNFFIPISKNAPIKIISASTVSPTLVFVDPKSNIKKFSDLANKKVAARIGSISNFALGYALVKENIDFNSIKFIDVDSTVRPLALMDKKIVDAAVAGADDLKTYSDLGAVVFDEWNTKGYANKPFPRTDIAVNTDFLKANKKTVGQFIDAFIESQKFIKDSPDEAADVVAKHVKKGTEGVVDYSVDDVKQAWNGTKYVLWYEPSDLVEISKVAQAIGDIKSPLTLDQIYDPSFEEKLKDAQSKVYPTI